MKIDCSSLEDFLFERKAQYGQLAICKFQLYISLDPNQNVGLKFIMRKLNCRPPLRFKAFW